ncbi:porin [Rhodoplanes sp. Z2-YC6860]|uniref:porin n=1 Tax=Rhodoplanes sp. Z2-YC6860 TaxID=674703 RepID=UPI00078DAFDD|nr:porin [Rhodoplanes sp. Z2-YC6860]AMN39523.1 Omp2b porin [Rhodoplanes sp. Z2-YC6860]
MNHVKSALVAGAASIAVVTTAPAADLPVKAKPIEYVKVCSLYGAGYYYIPGTDICMKVGGYLRAEVDMNAAGTLTPAVGPGSTNNRDNVNNRESQSFVQRARFLWSFDTRQQTEYGLLRSYARTGIQWSTGDSVNSGSNAVAYIDRAFLQFGGLTAGRAVSFFDVYSFSLHSFQTNIIGSDSGGTGINLLAYTADLGNGLSATLSAEEHDSRSKPVVNTIGTAGFLNLNNNAGGAPGNLGTGTFSSQAGQTLPNLVGAVRLDQPWGLVQGSVALAKVSSAYYSTGTAAAAGGGALAIGGGAGGLERLGHPDDKLGYAAGFGTVLNLPTAKGDTFGAQFTYSKGASAYAGQGQGTFNIRRGNELGIGFVTDAVYGGVGSPLSLTDAWSVTAGVEHYWNPKWRTSLYGGYERVSYNDAATSALCSGLATGGAGSAATGGGFTPTNCSPDFSFWQVGSRTVWSPVSSLDIGLDILYNHVNTAFAGAAAVSANGSVPSGLFTVASQGVLSGALRIQRNFVP